MKYQLFMNGEASKIPNLELREREILTGRVFTSYKLLGGSEFAKL